MKDRVDPQLQTPLENFLAPMGGAMNLNEIPALRAGMAQMLAAMKSQLPANPAVVSADRQVPGPAGAPDVAVRVYQPAERPANLPALVWIHGGGYVLGSVEQDDLFAQHIAVAAQCVVVSVDYRLAPECPFPGPLEDCYAALKWLAAHSAELGVDPKRIAIGGQSAGGGLAAGLALLARDRAEVAVAFQLLIYPMIDDRNVAPASAALADTLLWNRENNRVGWNSYLGAAGRADVSPYAAAARADHLAGLPPAHISVGELDLFAQENIDYARRLLLAGVPTELHIYRGAFHGFDGIAPAAEVSQRFSADRDRALKQALHG
jgi:acetyl esterase/lipase